MITYEKGAAPTQKICLSNQVKTDLRGLGTGVGGFSNLATTMYAMEGQFDPVKQAEQRTELRHRIKLLREIVGQEIDRIKGTAAPIVPPEWKKLKTIDPEDTDIEKAEKYKSNSMVITKKPYFFRYLYPELNKKYKQYEAAYNQMCLSMFGIKLKPLLTKQDKTEQEKNVIRCYQKYNPLITSNCIMNTLCREFENVDFDITYSKKSVSKLPTFENLYEFDQTRCQVIRSQYQAYISAKKVNIVKGFFNYESDKPDIQNMVNNYIDPMQLKVKDLVIDDIRQELFSNHDIDPKEFLFYANILAKKYKQFNWSFVWDVLDNQILSFIPQGNTYAPVNVFEVDSAELEFNPDYLTDTRQDYLGQDYILKDVSKNVTHICEKQNEEIVPQGVEELPPTEDYFTKDEELPVDNFTEIPESEEVDVEQPIEEQKSTKQKNNYEFYEEDNSSEPMQTMADAFAEFFANNSDFMSEYVDNKDDN